jgi:hypothetical protein
MCIPISIHRSVDLCRRGREQLIDGFLGRSFQARVQNRPGHGVAGAVHDSDVHPDGPGRGQQGMDGSSRLRRRHGAMEGPQHSSSISYCLLDWPL